MKQGGPWAFGPGSEPLCPGMPAERSGETDTHRKLEKFTYNIYIHVYNNKQIKECKNVILRVGSPQSNSTNKELNPTLAKVIKVFKTKKCMR